MSQKHPIIAVTGSSGAGTSTVKKSFEHIFWREKLTAAVVEGDSFHRYDRAAMKEAMAEFDVEKRVALLKEATKIGIDDVGFIPLFWPKVYWASKDNITYTANRGEDFMATLAGQAQ